MRLAYLVWRRGKYAELLHSYRNEEGKVRQIRLAYLGRHPVITDELKRRLARERPGVDIEWNAIEREMNAKTGDLQDPKGLARELDRTREALRRRTNAARLPILWAYFEARRRGQLEPDEPFLWARSDPPPRRRPSHSDKEATAHLWPIFRRRMESHHNPAALMEDPQAFTNVVRQVYWEAETEWLQRRDQEEEASKSERPGPQEMKLMGYDESLRLLNLPREMPLRQKDVEEAYEVLREGEGDDGRRAKLEAARVAAKEYVRRRAWL